MKSLNTPVVLLIYFFISSVTTMAAEPNPRLPCVITAQRGAFFNRAIIEKGNSAPTRVFVTFYLQSGNCAIEENLLQSVLAKATGGYYYDDPLPAPPTFSFIIRGPKDQDLHIWVRPDGDVGYRGILEVTKGVYEDDDSTYKPGAFLDLKIATELIQRWEQWKKAAETAERTAPENR